MAALGELCAWQYGAADDAPNVLEVVRVLTSHGRFQDIMNSSDCLVKLKLKETIVELLCVLQKVYPAMALQYPASSLLRAYNASTRPSDLALLKLLTQYENTGYMENLLPVVWGPSASRCFTGDPDDLVFREPIPEQIIKNLDMKMLVNTCLYFDINMKYSTEEKLDSIRNKHVVYDMRFMLPVLQFVARKYLELESQPTQQVLSLMVALSTAALSAHDVSIRGLGAKLLSMLHKLSSLHKIRSVRVYWTTIIDVVRFTLAAVATNVKQHLERIVARRPRYIPVEQTNGNQG